MEGDKAGCDPWGVCLGLENSGGHKGVSAGGVAPVRLA